MMDEGKVVEKIIKIFDTEIKSVDTKTNTIVAKVSTNKVDRHGDIVPPEAFGKRMKHYKQHPVLLSSHDYFDLRKQIGEATKLSVTNDGLEATFKYYAGEGNPEADWAWVLAQKGIASFSIGFMRYAFDWIKGKDEQGNEMITGRKFTDVELLEISQVLIPANRQALQERNDFAEEGDKLAELAMKAFKSGDLPETQPEAQPEKKPEEKPADAPADNSADKPEEKPKEEPKEEPKHESDEEIIKRTHYSEHILNDGEKPCRSNKEAIEGAVREAVKSVI